MASAYYRAVMGDTQVLACDHLFNAVRQDEFTTIGDLVTTVLIESGTATDFFTLPAKPLHSEIHFYVSKFLKNQVLSAYPFSATSQVFQGTTLQAAGAPAVVSGHGNNNGTYHFVATHFTANNATDDDGNPDLIWKFQLISCDP